MPQASGTNVVVNVYHEATWGSPDATGRKVVVNSVALDASVELIKSEALRGGRGSIRGARGNVKADGSIKTELAPTVVGFWLKHLLGAPVTTGAGPYVHTFVPGTLPAGFSVEKDWRTDITSKVELFKGCRLNAATFTFPQAGFVTADLEVMGRERTIATTPRDAAAVEPGTGHAGFTSLEASLKQGGSVLAAAMEGSLKVENNLSGDVYTLSLAGKRYALASGRCAISGSVKVVFDAFTLVDLADAATDTTVEFVLTRGTGAGSAGNEMLTFTVTHCELMPTSVPVDTEAGIIATFEFVAFSSAADPGLSVVLKNAVAAASL
ncbi:phage tail tube protein [Lamprocystis purpurea]|jgi:hypothetical protein|uniref:phage tail tube protein n=1 Tax=Lamprocystis purpurea TaxID=61598 RepID=UPI000364648B|nr:phage tail tube protein [Lamprocystis purpurea]